MMITGPENVLRSADSIEDNEGFFPLEYVNTIDIPGMPPHLLKLKKGCPVILLRNLDPEKGLCNGTRLIVHSITQRILTVYRSADPSKTLIAIPRIDLLSQEGVLPFIFKRRQFPVRLAFGMTINKSQGQSLETVGILLRRSVFGHGQLYVALSRSGNPVRTMVLIENEDNRHGHFDCKSNDEVFIRNVVY
jgi:ATP-dependent DNA helicase PIF1